MWKYQDTDELYHHGVLGMKWGRRKSRISKSTSKNSNDYNIYKELKRKKTKRLSNSELKKVNERDNLERQYKLNNPNLIKKASLLLGTTAATLGTIASIKNNKKMVVNMGKNIANKYKKTKVWWNSL